MSEGLSPLAHARGFFSILMTIAYFDCFSGIAGDMALGALLDCGVPLDELRQGLSSLPVSGWSIEAQPVLRGGIHALDVSISLHGQTDADELHQLQRAGHSHAHPHGHHHEHSHEHGEHSHGHEHSHSHEHEHSHEQNNGTAAHVHGRSMAEIRELIEAGELSECVRKTALDIFWSIAQVEAKMHHSTPEEIHFHEIGGVDSLIDICGVAWCLDYLGVDEVHCSALPYSTGYVDCAHGRMPVPAPATLELLKGVPMFPTEIRGEMVTPTGAGIVATLAQSFGAPPALVPRHIGIGAGKKQWPDRPNLLRVVIGEKIENAEPATPHSVLPKGHPRAPRSECGLEWRTLELVETNIDDMNPELFDHVLTRLFAAGAVDAWMQPAQMKKNRPGQLLSALCAPDARDAIIAVMLRETTTLGVRVGTLRRAALPRESHQVPTPFGTVRVKATHWPQGGVHRAAPEYDDVTRLATEHGVAACEVYAAALSVAQRVLEKSATELSDSTTAPETVVSETQASGAIVPQEMAQPAAGREPFQQQASQQ